MDVMLYFKSWIFIVIFPFFLLLPDLGVFFIKTVCFSTPRDVMCLREQEFKFICEKRFSQRGTKQVVAPYEGKEQAEAVERLKLNDEEGGKS